MEVRDAIFGEQPGRYIHRKVIALIPRLHPYVEGRNRGYVPGITDAADADAFRIPHPCLHKGPDHIDSPKDTVRERY